jgi:hypothetical protein
MPKNPTKASAVTKNKTRKKAKRRKKSRYHTGTYLSPKCPTPINYRSGWEKTVCEYLDNDPLVVGYTYEAVEIHYTSGPTTKRIRKYLPDFMVWYTDGKVKMVEVKRQNLLTNVRVQRKAEAAKIWCASQSPQVTYEFWTDKIVLPLQKAAKIRERYLKKQK